MADGHPMDHVLEPVVEGHRQGQGRVQTPPLSGEVTSARDLPHSHNPAILTAVQVSRFHTLYIFSNQFQVFFFQLAFHIKVKYNGRF
jgi:hypothetical protein